MSAPTHAAPAPPAGARCHAGRLRWLSWLVLLAGGCDGTRLPDGDAGSAPPVLLSESGFLGSAANGDGIADRGRPARYAPVWVQGRGAFADGLPGRIGPGLAEGWIGTLRVADGCAQDDCLHWSLVSVDAHARVEQLPAIAIADAVTGEGAEATEARVRAHAESVRATHFPDARVVSVVSEDARGYGASHQLMLAIAYPHAGREMTAGIRAWLQAVDARQHGSNTTSGTGTQLRTRIFSAPEDTFDLHALSDVAESAWLSAEGTDARLTHCLNRAHVIRYQQYIGADDDAAAATSRCHQEDAMRRGWETPGQVAGRDAAAVP